MLPIFGKYQNCFEYFGPESVKSWVYCSCVKELMGAYIRPVIKNNFTVWMRQSLIQGGGVEICQAVSFALFLAFLAP